MYTQNHTQTLTEALTEVNIFILWTSSSDDKLWGMQYMHYDENKK